jgi:hypothetical protein
MKYDLLFQNRRIARFSADKVGEARNLWKQTLHLCYFMPTGFCRLEAHPFPVQKELQHLPGQQILNTLHNPEHAAQ